MQVFCGTLFAGAIWYGACREHRLTAHQIREILSALPARIISKIQKISKATGESIEEIIERAVDRYGAKAKPPMIGDDEDDELAQLLQIPKNRDLFEKITSAMGRRASAIMTPEQKRKRAEKAASARAASMTPERRKEISEAAIAARWRKRDEQRKAEESGGKQPPTPKK